MDGLALLCNLHAGGPTTLARLRGAGIRSLEQLTYSSDLELAQLLEAPPLAARRFAREAEHLLHRIGPRPSPPAPEPLMELRPAQRVRPLPSRPMDPVEHARVPILAPRPRPAAPEARATGLAPDTLLRPALVEGLTERTCKRLIARGVRTLDQLVRSASPSLAQRIALPYPELLDLAHAAQRRLSGPSRPAPGTGAPTGAPQCEGAGEGAGEGEREGETGPAGPFA